MNTSSEQSSTTSTPTPSREVRDLIETLDRHRGFLLHTAEGLTETQARTASTVSALTIASLLKHVADTEESWMQFAVQDRPGFEDSEVDSGETDREEAFDEAGQTGDWDGDSGWEDTRFVLTDEETLDVLRARVREVAERTAEILGSVDLDADQLLPEAPWFEKGARWSVRRIAIHLLAEISQHAGHADIIREAIDGQRTMG